MIRLEIGLVKKKLTVRLEEERGWGGLTDLFGWMPGYAFDILGVGHEYAHTLEIRIWLYCITKPRGVNACC